MSWVKGYFKWDFMEGQCLGGGLGKHRYFWGRFGG